MLAAAVLLRLPALAQSRWEAQAENAFRAQNAPAALAASLRWTQDEPRNPEAWRVLGHAQCWNDHVTAAESAYMRMSALRPNDATPWMLLAGCYGRNHMHGAAVNRLVEAVKRDPNSAELWMRLGTEYRNKADADVLAKRIGILNGMDQHTADEYASSTYAFRKVLALGGGGHNEQYIWNQIGGNYYHLNDYPNAIGAYREALRRDPHDRYSRNGMSLAIGAMRNQCTRRTTRPAGPDTVVVTTSWACDRPTTAFINQAANWLSSLP